VAEQYLLGALAGGWLTANPGNRPKAVTGSVGLWRTPGFAVVTCLQARRVARVTGAKPGSRRKVVTRSLWLAADPRLCSGHRRQLGVWHG
jgi:hypothetical protein